MRDGAHASKCTGRVQEASRGAVCDLRMHFALQYFHCRCILTMQVVHWCLLHRDTSLLVQFALAGALHRRQPFRESFPVSARQYLFEQYHRRVKILKSGQVIFVIDTSLLDSNTSFLVDQNCCYNALVQINLCSIAGQMVVSCPSRLSSI